MSDKKEEENMTDKTNIFPKILTCSDNTTDKIVLRPAADTNTLPTGTQVSTVIISCCVGVVTVVIVTPGVVVFATVLDMVDYLRGTT